MGGNPSPIRPGLTDEERGAQDERTPAQISRDARGQTTLSVERSDQLPDVDDLRFQLDDEQGPCRGVPREQVDDAPLAKDVERDLRSKLPSRFAAQPGDDILAQRGVLAVEHPIEITAAPPGDELESDLEDVGNFGDRREAELVEAASLDPGNGRGGYAGAQCDIDLAPPKS